MKRSLPWMWILMLTILLAGCARPNYIIVFNQDERFHRIGHCDDGRYVSYDLCAQSQNAYGNLQPLCRGRIYSINNVLQAEGHSDIYWFYTR